MVISIEPRKYLPDVGGIRHSVTVLVTKVGYVILTNYPTELDKLIVTAYAPVKSLVGIVTRSAVGADDDTRTVKENLKCGLST